MKEENKDEIENNEENNMTYEEVKYIKRQWLYKTIIVIVAIGCIIGLLASSITYYLVTKEKTEKFTISTSNAKSLDSDGNEVKEVVTATESMSSLSALLSTFAEFIDENYIGEIDKNELINSTLKGFIEGIGDEYSEYMTAEEWEEYQADALGNYVGVGIYMRIDDETNYTIVDSTIKETPAEEAGIKSGDLIIGVDGESTYGLTASEVSSKIKGEEGTDVTLTIYRNGETMEFTMQRQAIKVYHVSSELKEDGIGYIYLYTFDENCSTEFEKEMDSLIEQGAKKVVLDLRYNTGGLVSEALSILDLFLDKGDVELITKSANGDEEITKSATDKKYDVDLVVLVNKYSASASEILTGALKDNGVAKVVGTVTYGKGVIQNVYQLTDGSVLKLTTQEYYTPNETKINKVGITPDYEVELSDEDIENSKDTQLEAAIKLLKGEEIE
jgi:carboxyl-terminal processing protease